MGFGGAWSGGGGFQQPPPLIIHSQRLNRTFAFLSRLVTLLLGVVGFIAFLSITLRDIGKQFDFLSILAQLLKSSISLSSIATKTFAPYTIANATTCGSSLFN